MKYSCRMIDKGNISEQKLRKNDGRKLQPVIPQKNSPWSPSKTVNLIGRFSFVKLNQFLLIIRPGKPTFFLLQNPSSRSLDQTGRNNITLKKMGLEKMAFFSCHGKDTQ